MAVDSHIQLPKGILKYFVDSENQVWYLDVDTCEIDSKGASVLGTQYGYFSDGVEAYLQKSIEDPITQVNAHVRKCLANEPSSLKFSARTTERLRNFVIAAMARSDLARQSLLATLDSPLQKYNRQYNDALIKRGMTHFCEDPNFLRGYTIGVIINKTPRPLVTLRNCFYTFDRGDYHSIIVPISPTAALALHSKCDLTPSGETIYVGEVISDEREIEKINTRAMLYEYIYNKTFIATNDRAELQRLSEILKKDRQIFDAIRSKARNGI
jgi:hypothetical protein